MLRRVFRKRFQNGTSRGKISDICGCMQDECWVIKFRLNGIECSISLPNTDTDWYQSVFRDQLNQHLENQGIKELLSDVILCSVYNIDQTLNQVFISKEMNDRLKFNEPAFVFDQNRHTLYMEREA